MQSRHLKKESAVCKNPEDVIRECMLYSDGNDMKIGRVILCKIALPLVVVLLHLEFRCKSYERLSEEWLIATQLTVT